jgi:glycolate oxidase FAD binding subunit
MKTGDRAYTGDDARGVAEGRPTDEARPAAQVRPTDEAQLREILARAGRDATTCYIRGGGTKEDWGGRTGRFDLVLSTAGLCGLADVDPDNLTLSAPAGTTVAEARAQAKAVNRILPLDPARPARATIGGVAATGDQGARAAGYGGLRDLVLGIRATLADGSAVRFGGRTMKNVTGYDMTKLFVGSFGVLGVITEVTFRLLPRYDTQALAVLPQASFDEAKASVVRILTSHLQPMALEVVSADALPPELARSAAKLPAGRGGTASEPATAGAPGAGGQPILLAGFGGHRAAVDRSIREVVAAHAGAAPRVLSDEAAETVYEHLAESGAAAGSGDAAGPAASETAEAGGEAIAAGSSFTVRASVPVSRALDLVAEAQSCAAANGLSLGYRAGAARGRVDLLFADRDGGDSGEMGFGACLTQLRARAAAMGGSLFVTGGSRLLPPGYDAWGDIGPALVLMRRIKERFDPKHILNPGRFVGGI